MAPKLLPSLGFHEGEKNPSILVTSQDDFDLRDDWSEHDKVSTSRWRKSCPDKWSTTPTSHWSSRLTSLSSSVVGAGTTLTTRAKQLGVGISTHRAFNQLRKSIGEVTFRTELLLKESTPVQDQSSEVDGMEDHRGNESMYCDDDTEEKFKRLHSPWSWFKLVHRE
ncbi:unnamed protein product [Peronospora belbahrii]|uniref:Uncharacterized protein n=1 Tax=Peronospora belbahrii TaxID=622444 RepID=A0AAU9KMH1_9STRA|nr:unnamed protein product [Peronospora belbahrii]CAH0514817.1 unnamed protein product [Peronospora belbahrii]